MLSGDPVRAMGGARVAMGAVLLTTPGVVAGLPRPADQPGS